jgi:hypothetical protein
MEEPVRVEDKLLDLLKVFEDVLPKTDYKQVYDILSSGEPDMGYEMFCWSLFTNKVPLDQDIYNKLSSMGELMGVPDGTLSMLLPQIRNTQFVILREPSMGPRVP